MRRIFDRVLFLAASIVSGVIIAGVVLAGGNGAYLSDRDFWSEPEWRGVDAVLRDAETGHGSAGPLVRHDADLARACAAFRRLSQGAREAGYISRSARIARDCPDLRDALARDGGSDVFAALSGRYAGEILGAYDALIAETIARNVAHLRHGVPLRELHFVAREFMLRDRGIARTGRVWRAIAARDAAARQSP